MLKLKKHQISSFKQKMKSQTIAGIEASLRNERPVWFQQNGDGYTSNYIKTVVAHCEKIRILRKAYIHRVLRLAIDHHVALPFPPYLNWLLSKAEFDEGYRIKSFESALLQEKNPMKISLDEEICGSL